MKLDLSSNLKLAKTITQAENDPIYFEKIYKEIHGKSGNAVRIGLTGPPGAGKSTLINQLVKRLNKSGKSIAILSVDASSPLTHGALLGDRIRFLIDDKRIFYRSMANRGSTGGISDATGIALNILDYSGKEIIIVETVGIGQTEIDIKVLVDILIVVLVPEAGDSIQMIKSGMMEIGDIYLVNKCDRPGAAQKYADIKQALEMQATRYTKEDFRMPDVFLTNARIGENVDELIESIQREYNKKNKSGILEELGAQRTTQLIQKLLHKQLQRYLTNKDFSESLDENDLQKIQANLWHEFFKEIK